VHMSNVMPIDPDSNKPTRVANRVVDGRRARVGRRSGAVLGAQTGKTARKGGAKGAKKED
jgi:hypothetical protein